MCGYKNQGINVSSYTKYWLMNTIDIQPNTTNLLFNCIQNHFTSSPHTFNFLWQQNTNFYLLLLPIISIIQFVQTNKQKLTSKWNFFRNQKKRSNKYHNLKTQSGIGFHPNSSFYQIFWRKKYFLYWFHIDGIMVSKGIWKRKILFQ